jgi:hypothetical protein
MRIGDDAVEEDDRAGDQDRPHAELDHTQSGRGEGNDGGDRAPSIIASTRRSARIVPNPALIGTLPSRLIR